jgi:hypothetical protein
MTTVEDLVAAIECSILGPVTADLRVEGGQP